MLVLPTSCLSSVVILLFFLPSSPHRRLLLLLLSDRGVEGCFRSDRLPNIFLYLFCRYPPFFLLTLVMLFGPFACKARSFIRGSFSFWSASFWAHSTFFVCYSASLFLYFDLLLCVFGPFLLVSDPFFCGPLRSLTFWGLYFFSVCAVCVALFCFRPVILWSS